MIDPREFGKQLAAIYQGMREGGMDENAAISLLLGWLAAARPNPKELMEEAVKKLLDERAKDGDS